MSKILVIGSLGQIGTALTFALRRQYGDSRVVAADVRVPNLVLQDRFLFEQLDVTNAVAVRDLVKKHDITEVYLLAALLSANGERNPQGAWSLNMQSLMHCLELAREGLIKKLFWPSSIAVFGPDAPRVSCPQDAPQNPATMYGITKSAGEQLCRYYHDVFGVDVRSLRYPGLISHEGKAGGGTTDYAVDIYHAAIQGKMYQCYLGKHTPLPMMYMPDAVRATLELMLAKPERISIRTSYNLSAMTFTPHQLTESIRRIRPDFSAIYVPDHRQAIADSWPHSPEDTTARSDWGWWPQFNLGAMTRDMLSKLTTEYLFSPQPAAVHGN